MTTNLKHMGAFCLLFFLISISLLIKDGSEQVFADDIEASKARIRQEVNEPKRNITDAEIIKPVTLIGGAANDIAIQGNYAYIGLGSRLAILDLTDPTLPIIVGETGAIGFSNSVRSVTVSGNYAYISAGRLFVYQISDPTTPAEVADYEIYESLIEVQGNRAYVAPDSSTVNGKARMKILNISEPDNISEIGYYDVPDMVFDMAISGDYAFLAGWTGLHIVDISDPGSPHAENSLPSASWATAVAVNGNYAYVAYKSGTVHVVDVQTPASPTMAGSYYSAGENEDIAISNGYAFLAKQDGPLQVVDVSIPENPLGAGLCDLAGWLPRLAVNGDHVYAAGSRGGLRVVDVSDPDHPSEVGAYEVYSGANFAAYDGKHLFVTDTYNGLWVVDVSDPDSPDPIGQFKTPKFARSVIVKDDYAYISVTNWTDETSSIYIVDLSTPSAPSEEGTYDAPDYITGFAVANDYAYLATYRDGLRVVDISDTENPTEAGHFNTDHNAWDVAVAGNHAYVVGDLGMRVVDISDPSKPTEAGTYDFPVSANVHSIEISGHYAFLPADFGGLIIVDISIPDQPAEFRILPELSKRVRIDGEYLYLLSPDGYLSIYWLNLPSQIIRIIGLSELYNRIDLALANNHLYLTDQENGLQVASVDFSSLLLHKMHLPITIKAAN